MKTILITGTSSGIGEAAAIYFAQKNFNVVGIARRNNSHLVHPNITQIQFDLSDTDHIDTLIAKLPHNLQVHYVIHNAATEGYLKSLVHLSLTELRHVMRLNFEAPFLLTQKLLGSFLQGARVLQISSGLAHNPLLGAGSYCVSKSALYMLYLCWNQDLKGKVLVGSLDPGIVGTAMQDRLRASNKEEFESHQLFHDIKASGALKDPSGIAEFMHHILLETSDVEFIKKEWVHPGC